MFAILLPLSLNTLYRWRGAWRNFVLIDFLAISRSKVLSFQNQPPKVSIQHAHAVLQSSAATHPFLNDRSPAHDGVLEQISAANVACGSAISISSNGYGDFEESMAPQSDHQAIQNLHNDHVDDERPYDKMIPATNMREVWRTERWQVEDGQWVQSSPLQLGSLQTMRSGRPCLFSSTRRQKGPAGTWQYLFLLITYLWVIPTSAALIEFQNCLSESVQATTSQLQLVPLVMNAVFNTTDPNHNLNVTVWTNVTGSEVGNLTYTLPPANSSYWDPGNNDTTVGGKIENEPAPNVPKPVLTTLFSKVGVLTYTPYNPRLGDAFCTVLVNGTCPLGPNFKDNL